jgi:hypothetical protein
VWNPFRRKSAGSGAGQAPSKERPVDRVDDIANRLYREGRTSELERELLKLDPATLPQHEQESWWHLYGITAFQQGRDSEALTRFQEAHRRFPDSASITFGLGQQYLRTRAIEEGFALFRTCKFPALSREFALAQARYAYLWNRYQDGLLFIRPFSEAYKQLKIMDDHFLYMRGLPFFGQWWSYLAALSILSGDTTELEEATRHAVRTFRDYDFDSLQTELAAYRDDKPDLLLGPLEKRLASMNTGQFPSGYIRMSIGVVKARAASTLEAAEGVLNGVTLSQQDFGWLEDVRTLALAEAASRFGASDLENQRIESFLARQQLLFEPDIALNFHLLRYQERLKPRVTT